MMLLNSQFELPPHLLVQLDVLDTAPTIEYIYGENEPEPENFCWMKYVSIGTVGEIAFTRNTSQALPDACAFVVQYLESLLL